MLCRTRFDLFKKLCFKLLTKTRINRRPSPVERVACPNLQVFLYYTAAYRSFVAKIIDFVVVVMLFIGSLTRERENLCMYSKVIHNSMMQHLY